MGKQAYAEAKAEQKTFIGLSLNNSLLQRKCACGGSPGIEGECEECLSKRYSSSSGSQHSSQLTAAASPPLVQENSLSPTEMPTSDPNFFINPNIGHHFSRVQPHKPVSEGVQTKLTINQPGDIYEQEADRVAEQVMRMAVPSLSSTPTMQDDESKDETVMCKEESSAFARGTAGVPPIVQHVLSSNEGQPLDAATRSFMEPRFGHDFSRVRVHTDAQAAESAHSLDALAYTIRQNIVFGAGEYTPGTLQGQRLLAHELTHVVQQGISQTKLAGKLEIASPNDPLEREANRAASSIARGEYLTAISLHQGNSSAQGRLYRQPSGSPSGGGGSVGPRKIHLDASVIDELNRGNKRVAADFKRLKASGAQISISAPAYIELTQKGNLQLREANKLLIDELKVRKVLTGFTFEERTEGYTRIAGRGTKLQGKDMPMVVLAQEDGAELWTFDMGVRQNAPLVGVPVIPESNTPKTGQRPNYAVARELMGLDPIEISPDGVVKRLVPRGGGGPAGGTTSSGSRGGGLEPPPGSGSSSSESKVRGPHTEPRKVIEHEPPLAGSKAPVKPSAAPKIPEEGAIHGSAGSSGAGKAELQTTGRSRPIIASIEADFRLLRVAKVLTAVTHILDLISTLSMLYEFVSSTQSRLAGKGFILVKEIEQAKRFKEGAAESLAAYRNYSDSLQIKSKELFRVFDVKDPIGAVRAANSVRDLWYHLASVEAALSVRIDKVESTIRYLRLKQAAIKKILESPEASRAIAMATFGTAELARLVEADSDLDNIDGELSEALSSMAEMDNLLKADIGSLVSWEDDLLLHARP